MDALSKRRTRDPIPFALRLRSLGSFMLYSRETYTHRAVLVVGTLLAGVGARFSIR